MIHRGDDCGAGAAEHIRLMWDGVGEIAASSHFFEQTVLP